jgi:hypothetical protein
LLLVNREATNQMLTDNGQGAGAEYKGTTQVLERCCRHTPQAGLAQ